MTEVSDRVKELAAFLDVDYVSLGPADRIALLQVVVGFELAEVAHAYQHALEVNSEALFRAAGSVMGEPN